MPSLLMVGFLTALALAAPLGKLMPVDEAPKNPSFLAFRTRLLEIVKRQDAAALEPIIDPHITYTYGGGEPGWKGFRQYWKLDQPGSELWPLLEHVLNHGGGFQKDGSFAAPYVTAIWPDDLEPYGYGAIMGEHVRVRARPAADAPVVGELSYDLVVVDRKKRWTKGWVPVQLAGGGTGYVSARYFSSPVDYRAYFSQKSGQWRMTVFVAGD